MNMNKNGIGSSEYGNNNNIIIDLSHGEDSMEIMERIENYNSKRGMKTFIVLGFFVLLLIISFSTFFFFDFSKVPNGDFVKEAKEQEVVKKISARDVKIEYAGEENKTIQNYLNNKVVETLEKIDDNIIVSFVNNGWKIKLVPVVTRSDNSTSSKIIGYTNSEERTCYIKSTEQGIENSLIHELGHFWEYQRFSAVHDDYFELIYQVESKNLYEWGFDEVNNSYITSNVSEYFAESFAQYYKNPDKLNKNCPKTYSFMFKIIKG